MNNSKQSSPSAQRLESISVIALSIGIVILLIVQFSSLYVAPVHNSQALWYGDESWLMNEYKEQAQTGVFRHPSAVYSTIAVSNPFPFAAMWITSWIYGGAAALFPHENFIDVGRTITAIIAVSILIVMLLRARRNSILSALTGIALLISCRNFFLSSHCARYDIITAGAVLLMMMYLGSKEKHTTKELMIIGAILGACLLISAHAPLMLVLPVTFVAFRSQRNPLKYLPMLLSCIGVVGLMYVFHLITQPSAVNVHNITSGMGDQPYLHPFNRSFQLYNLEKKIDTILGFALPMLLMIAILIVGNLRGDEKSWGRIVLWLLPILGWFYLEGVAVRYLIYVLPALAFGSAVSLSRLHSTTRLAIVILTFVTMSLAFRDALQAKSNGEQLSRNVTSALDSARSYLGDGPVVAMSPALSYLESDPGFRDRLYTTHFVWMPNIPAKTAETSGSLLFFVKQSDYFFIWEVPVLRQEMQKPEFVMIGKFLDARSSYFEPLDPSVDTLLIQQVKLDTLLQHYRR